MTTKLKQLDLKWARFDASPVIGRQRAHLQSIFSSALSKKLCETQKLNSAHVECGVRRQLFFEVFEEDVEADVESPKSPLQETGSPVAADITNFTPISDVISSEAVVSSDGKTISSTSKEQHQNEPVLPEPGLKRQQVTTSNTPTYRAKQAPSEAKPNTCSPATIKLPIMFNPPVPEKLMKLSLQLRKGVVHSVDSNSFQPVPVICLVENHHREEPALSLLQAPFNGDERVFGSRLSSTVSCIRTSPLPSTRNQSTDCSENLMSAPTHQLWSHYFVGRIVLQMLCVRASTTSAINETNKEKEVRGGIDSHKWSGDYWIVLFTSSSVRLKYQGDSHVSNLTRSEPAQCAEGPTSLTVIDAGSGCVLLWDLTVSQTPNIAGGCVQTDLSASTRNGPLREVVIHTLSAMGVFSIHQISRFYHSPPQLIAPSQVATHPRKEIDPTDVGVKASRLAIGEVAALNAPCWRVLMSTSIRELILTHSCSGSSHSTLVESPNCFHQIEICLPHTPHPSSWSGVEMGGDPQAASRPQSHSSPSPPATAIPVVSFRCGRRYALTCVPFVNSGERIWLQVDTDGGKNGEASVKGADDTQFRPVPLDQGFPTLTFDTLSPQRLFSRNWRVTRRKTIGGHIPDSAIRSINGDVGRFVRSERLKQVAARHVSQSQMAPYG
eukprot:GHVN01066711.1.p1 GENE.GHVN01066711.1~~GHVN01066711.1.p1  ORF type:complete len:665 (+),score=117.29 GHVN01066711.1:1324-3318(+)